MAEEAHVEKVAPPLYEQVGNRMRGAESVECGQNPSSNRPDSSPSRPLVGPYSDGPIWIKFPRELLHHQPRFRKALQDKVMEWQRHWLTHKKMVASEKRFWALTGTIF